MAMSLMISASTPAFPAAPVLALAVLLWVDVWLELKWLVACVPLLVAAVMPLVAVLVVRCVEL